MAALSRSIPVVAVQRAAISKPGDAEIAPTALPSVTPIVSHESNSEKPRAALLAIAKNAGLTPPM